MTTFYLIRHGLIDPVGHSIAGRASGIHLNEEGRRQLIPLTEWLARRSIDRILSSPLERAQETAAPLARKLGLPVETHEALLEIDFGDWTGRTFDELREEAGWAPYNSFRSGTATPGGELMLDAQRRIVGLMLDLRTSFPECRIALFTHGDVIRAALLYWLGMPLDLFLRLEISPAGVSCIELGPDWVRVPTVNLVPEAPTSVPPLSAAVL